MAAIAAPANDAPTLGWDTVFAVTTDELTDAIKRRGSSPKSMKTKPSGLINLVVTADFGYWEVIPGGDGGTLNFAAPMTNLVGNYVLNGVPGTVTCADALAVIGIKLSAAPHLGPAYGVDGKQLPPPDAGTTRHALTPRSKSTDPLDPVAIVNTVDFRQPLSDPQAHGVVRQAIGDWCNDNLADFTHVFAFIDLNDQMATGAWAFCKPHTMSYAYVDRADKKSGFLAVLCMTSADPVPNQQVDGFAVPPGCGAGLLIRSKRFLVDMVQPGLLQMWPNLKDTDLEIASNDKILKMKAGTSVLLPDVTDKNGNGPYTPNLLTFELQILGTELQITTHTEVEVSPGIYGTNTSVNWYNVTLGANANGDQTLVYAQSRPPSNTPGNRTDSGVAIAMGVLKAITVVLGLLVIVLTDGAAIVVAAALFVALAGQLTFSQIEDAATADAPSLDDLTTNFTGPIVWTDKNFKLSTGGLVGSLQLGGTWI